MVTIEKCHSLYCIQNCVSLNYEICITTFFQSLQIIEFLNVIKIMYRWRANIGARPHVWFHKVLELKNAM